MKFSTALSLTFIFTALLLCGSVLSQSKQPFIILLDAGHGGKDPGNSYHGFKEKDIALKTTLKVVKYLESHKDIKVIYTRTNDVFIELANRPKIANKANANLFISIHCNSVKNFGPKGTETFVMGLSRTDMNLEVAKAENSVILLEDNYKETYKGFNPKEPETLMGLTMMQEENLNNSINLATKIQNNFTINANRSSRGVKQQPLWVLDAAGMPGILIELGFLSNKEEGAFLNSNEGQEKMALQIANAIIDYKKEYYGDSQNDVASHTINQTSNTEKPAKSDVDDNQTIYKIQLSASSKKIKLTSSNFKGLDKLSKTYSNSVYKYMYGETNDLEEAKKLQAYARKKGFSDAFIITIQGK